jgi:hypothetical protein
MSSKAMGGGVERMPSYWTPKQERQYKHIKASCISRKCRRVRGKRKCVRTCTRIAAATTNKFRARGLGAVRGKCCVVRGKKRIACFHSRRDAVALAAALKKTRGLRIRCV